MTAGSYYRKVVVTVTVAVSVLMIAQPAVASSKLARNSHLRWHAVSLRDQMLSDVNESRQAHGLAPLKLNATLSEDSWQHSIDMVRLSTLFHTESSAMWALVRRYGASRWGENVGYAATLEHLEELWMQSIEHRDNILDPNFRYAGVGVVHEGGWFWVTLRLYG